MVEYQLNMSSEKEVLTNVVLKLLEYCRRYLVVKFTKVINLEVILTV